MSAPIDFNAADREPLAMAIERIKAHTDIVDIVGLYAALKKRRAEYWAKCPLHTDRTPSFKVNEQRQQFMCFGCGAKGDVLDFVMAAENLDLPPAVKRVGELAGAAASNPAAAAVRAA